MGGASAPGVTYTPITSKTTTITYKPKRIRNQRRFTEDLNVVQEYQREQESITKREEEPKSKPPVWKKILGSKAAKAVGKGLQYSSLSEAATKIPGIGDEIEAGLDYIPGVREALQVGTNVPAWALAIPTGGGSLAATAATMGAASAGSGLGAYALSDDPRGLGLDLPGVPEKYERFTGSLIGGAVGAGAASRIVRTRALAAGASAEENIRRMEQGALQADDVLFTPDFQTFTPRRPTVDLPDKPLTWHQVRVKDSSIFQHNADDLSYRLQPEPEAALRTQILDANANRATDIRDMVRGNPAFEIAGEKPASTSFLRNIAEGAGRVADVSLPGWRTVARIDKGIGKAIGSLAPKQIEGVAQTVARPSVLTGLAAITHPSEAKDLVRKALEVDHKIGLNIAQAVLPQWELDVNAPDWLPGGDFTVDVEGVGAELFRPTNLINFTPAGTAVKGGLILKSGARLAGAKALGEIAIREGAGNAVFAGLDAWAQGANKDGILQSMALGFGAGAALGVPLNIAMPLAQHHLGRAFDIVNNAPDENEAAKALLTMQKNLEADYPETLPAAEPSLESRVGDVLSRDAMSETALRTEPVGPVDVRSLQDRADALYEELQAARASGDEELISELTDEYEGALTAVEDAERMSSTGVNALRTEVENPVTPEELAFGSQPDEVINNTERWKMIGDASRLDDPLLSEAEKEIIRTQIVEAATAGDELALDLASKHGLIDEEITTSRYSANVETVGPEAGLPIIEDAPGIMYGEARLGELPKNKAFWVTPDNRVFSNADARGTHQGVAANVTGVMDDPEALANIQQVAASNGWVRGYLDNTGLSIEGNNIDRLRDVASLVEDKTLPVYYDINNSGTDLVYGTLKDNANWLANKKELGHDLELTDVTAGKSTVGEFTSGQDLTPSAEAPEREFIGGTDYTIEGEVPADIRGNVERWYRQGANREPMSEEEFNKWFDNIMRATKEPAPRAIPNYKQSGTLVEDVQAQSMRRIAHLFEDQVEDTNYGIGSTETHYKPITGQMAKEVFVKEYVDLTGRHIGELPGILRRAGVLPDDWNEFSYGGILVDRITPPDEPMTSVSGVYLVTPGEAGKAGMGDGIIATDPSSIASAVTYKMNRAIDSDDLGSIFRIFGDQARFSDVLAYFMVANNFHEAVHRVILGHGKNFKTVLDNIREAGAPEFDAMVKETAEMTNRWSEDGSLQKLGDYTNDILRIQEQFHNAGGGQPEGGLAAANLQRTGAGDGISETGSLGDSGIRGSATEGGTGLEGDLPESPAGQAGEEPSAGAGGSGDRGGIGRDTGLAGDTEPDAGGGGEPAPIEPSPRPADVAAPIGHPAFDVQESFRLADEDVHISRAGTGWDLYLAGAKGKDRIVKELPTIQDYIDTELTDDKMRAISQRLAGTKAGKAIVEIMAGKAASAKQQFEKAVVGYRMLLESMEGRKFSTMNWLRQSKPPFEEVYDPAGKIHRMRVLDANGNTVIANIDDVYSNPSKYQLNSEQKAYIYTGHRIIDELVDEMKSNGVDIKELGIEKRGEHYWPRFVEGKDGFTLEDIYGYDRQYAKKAVGSKQAFQKTRRFASVAEGEAAGVVYAHPIKALEGFVDAANKTIASKQLMAALEGYSISPKDLVFRDVGSIEINALADRHAKAVEYLNDLMDDPEKNAAKIVDAQSRVDKLQTQLDKTGGGVVKRIYKPLYGALAELKKVDAEGRQIKRELAAAKNRAKAAKGGTNRKLSMRELSSFAAEDPEVRRLQSALNDAKKRKITGKEPVAPDMAKKEARFKKALHDYEQMRRNFSKYQKEGITFTEDAKPVITRLDSEGKVVPRQPAKKTAGNITKEQVDAAYREMVEARKALGDDNIVAIGQQLKEALAEARKTQRMGHEVGRQGELQGRRQTVEQAEKRLSDWKLKQQTALANSRRVMGEMRSRLDRAKNVQTIDVDAFAAANDILPFEKDGKVAVRMLRGAPGLNNKWFPSDVATAIEKVVADEGFRGLEKISSVNDWARLARTSTDFGFLFIQGLPVLLRNPRAFAKAMSQSLQAFKDPESYARWFASKSDIVDDATPYIGQFSNSDYFTAARGSRIAELARKKVTSPTAAAQKAAGVGIQRFAISFDAFLDAAKISMWEGMMPHLKTPKEKAAYGRLIRNMTGTTSTSRLGVGTGQRQIEALLMFSPRFTRSVFALAGQAAQGDKQAILSLGAILGGGALVYTGAKYALTGEMPTEEDFNPTNGGRFMSVKVGDNYIGLGGSMRGALQLLGYSIASVQDPARFLSTDSTSNDHSNPFLKYARGRLSPTAGQAFDVLAGETFIGEDTTDRGAWLARMPDMFLPFAAQAWVETEGGTDQKLMTLAAQSSGFRSFPESPNEDLDALINEKIPGAGRWTDLTSFQQAQFLDNYPESRKLLDERDIANWTQYKEINLQAQKAKKSLGERWLQTQTRSNGEKVYPEDLTSKEYRDEIARINDQLSAARTLLSGGDPFTGLGGEFNRNANTPRQKLMKAYYEYVSKDKYTRPDGTIDYDMRQALEDDFMARVGPDDQAVIEEETTGSMVDPVESRLKLSRRQLSEYFDISDAVAQSMGYESKLAIESAPEAVQKRYNKLETARKEQWRRMNPDADRLLAIWGYTSKLITERDTGRGARNPVEKSINRVIKRITS